MVEITSQAGVDLVPGHVGSQDPARHHQFLKASLGMGQRPLAPPMVLDEILIHCFGMRWVLLCVSC